MLTEKFSNTIKRAPASAKALGLVQTYLETASSQQPLESLRLAPGQLQLIAEVPSSTDLAVLISLLLAASILRRVVLLHSPAGGVLAEFAAVDAIPDRVYDPSRNVWVQVTMADIQIIYVVESEGHTRHNAASRRTGE